MGSLNNSRSWPGRSRRRPYAIWLISFCLIALIVLQLCTSGLASKVESTDRRREEFPQQRPLKHPTTTLGEAKVQHVSEPRPTQSAAKLNDKTSPSEDLYAKHPKWLRTPGTKAFPSYDGYSDLVEQAESLPDLVYIPFEDAVAEDTLVGWEAEWLTSGVYDKKRWGPLQEPQIDFVYTWVNGSDEAFRSTKRPYELNSTLNDASGGWLAKHGENRYRDWNELKYSVRSVEEYAPFRNKIQVLANALNDPQGVRSKQVPDWLDVKRAGDTFEVLAQEDFFEADKQACLPTFNSLTIENQLHNTESTTDRMFALSDDMLLGRPHAASDIYSPLFGPLIALKSNSYNTVQRPTDADARRFGEKPWLIYTSWLLNRRFGVRKRKGQAHFGHSLSRKLSRETMRSFPGPDLQSACSRFRGDFGFQLYSWYANFHYTMERHREALLWSYLIHRTDADQDGYLSYAEREQIMIDLQEGLRNEGKSSFRSRNYYHLPEMLRAAGLEPPKVNIDVLWTSLDGPVMSKDTDCFMFDVNDCLAPGFSADDGFDHKRPVFSTAAILDRVARQQPGCGDCLIKILLHRAPIGLEPLMPKPKTQSKAFEVVVKALIRYQYVVTEPDGLFVMVTDADQVESTLNNRLLTGQKQFGQLCLNDDVYTEDEKELKDLHIAMNTLFEGLFPKPSRFEVR